MTIIVTPSEVIRLSAFPQPAGILWEQIVTPQQQAWLAAIPYMQELHKRKFGKGLSPTQAV
jgi:hypothetical protein